MENVSCCCLVCSLWSGLAAWLRSTEVNSTQCKNQFNAFYFTLHWFQVVFFFISWFQVLHLRESNPLTWARTWSVKLQCCASGSWCGLKALAWDRNGNRLQMFCKTTFLFYKPTPTIFFTFELEVWGPNGCWLTGLEATYQIFVKIQLQPHKNPFFFPNIQ